jgi:hypothetical protein
MKFGIVWFMPVQTVASDDIDMRLADLLADAPKPQSLGNTAQIGKKPKRIGKTVLVEASSPVFTAELRFSADNSYTGHYEIRYVTNGRKEMGDVERVITQEQPFKLSRLVENFAVRFGLITAANDRSRTHNYWLVGYTDFEIIPDNEIEDA